MEEFNTHCENFKFEILIPCNESLLINKNSDDIESGISVPWNGFTLFFENDQFKLFVGWTWTIGSSFVNYFNCQTFNWNQIVFLSEYVTIATEKQIQM